MKKNFKLMTGLMAVALLATPVLMGCGVTPGNGGSGSNGKVSYGAVETGDIQAPEYVVVGDKFNLDDYVTIQGGAGAKVFDATVNAVSEGVCTIDGHEVTVLKEGTISIAISVGPKDETTGRSLWDGKFSTKAISAIKAQYGDATKDITNQFMFYDVEVDERSGEVLGLSPMIRHTSEYVWISQWEYEDAAHTKIASGGIMRCGNGHTHFFSIDSTGKDLTVEPEHLTDLQYYYIASDFALPLTALETAEAVDPETGLKEEYLTVDNTSPYLNDFVSYNVGISWNSKYTTHSVNIYPVVMEDGKTYWEFDINVAYAASPSVSLGAGAMLILSTDDEDCKVPLLEKFIADKADPDDVEYSELNNAFDAIVNAKNYTLTSTVSFSYYDKATQTDVPIVDDSFDSPTAAIYNGYREVTTVNEGSVVTTATYGSTTEQSGYFAKDNKVYGYTVEGGKATTKEMEGVTDLWSKDIPLTAAALHSTNTAVYDANFRVNSNETVNGVTTIAMGLGDCPKFADAVLGLCGPGYTLSYNFNANATADDPAWSGIDATVTITADYVEVQTEIGWNWLDDAHSALVYLYITQRFTAVGTTPANTLPAGVNA